MHHATFTPSRIRNRFSHAKAFSFRQVLVLFFCYLLVLQPNAAFANPVGLTGSPASTNKALNDSPGGAWNLLNHIYSFFEGSEAGPTPVVAPVDAAVSRKIPNLSNGRIEGNLRVYTGQDFSFEGGFVVTNETYVVGTPNVQVATNATFNAGTIDESGSPDPVGYLIRVNGTSRLLGKIHRRSDPLAFPDTPASVPQPSGTRIVNINTTADLANIGDWSTLKELHVNKSGETINVPQGNYGAFSVTGNSRLNFSGVYNFSDGFSFASNASIKATGVTTINIGSSATISNTGVLIGENTLPGDIKINVLGPSLSISGNASIKALVRVPNGTATVSGASQVRGQVIADKVEITTNANVIGDTSSNAPGDTTAPTVTITSPANQETINNASVTVTGTAIDPGIGASGVSKVLVNNIEAIYNPSTTIWTANIALSYGQTPITVNATDYQGNTSPNLEISVIRPQDTTPPVVAITSPENNFITEASSITVSGTVSDPGAYATGVAQVTVNNSPATLNNGTWTIANVALTGDSTEITAVATDVAGNTSQPAKITVNKQAPQDTAVPTISITAPANNFTTPNASITVSGTAIDDNGPHATGVARVVVNNQPANYDAEHHTWTIDISLPSEGPNRIDAYAEDGASPANKSTTATIYVNRETPDTTPPTVTINPLTSLSTYDSTVNLSGTADDTGLIAKGVQSVTVNGAPATFDPTTHQWSASVTLSFGSNRLIVSATDRATPANHGEAEVTVTRLQLQPPDLKVTNPLNGAVVSSSSITVAGTVSSAIPNNLTLTVKGISTPIIGGQFARTIQLAEGPNPISVVAKDAQGQDTQVEIMVRRDVTAPSISFVNIPSSVQAGGNYQILVNATDDFGIADVELRLNGQSMGTVTTAPYQFTLSVPAAFNPGVTLVLSAVARDLTNTTSVATAQLQTAGPGGISGYVFDDTTGYVVQGVNALLNGSSPPVTTDELGVFSFVSTTPAGLVRLSKNGYTPVERLYKVSIGEGTALFDARLTPLDSQTNSIGASGGTINGDGGRVQVNFVAGALSQQTDLRVTSVSPQGLANLLPYGWSPVPGAIIDVRAADGSVLQSPSHLTISQVAGLASTTPLTLARYDETTHSWIVIGVGIQAAAGGALSADLPSLGQYAFLVADTGATAPPTSVVGQPLPSSQAADSAALDSAQATAESSPRAAAFSPVAKSSISFFATAAAQLPSGVSIEALFGDTYNLLGGKDAVLVDRPSQDFVLYAYPAATNQQPNRLGAFFIAKPTRTNFSITELFNANVHVEIRSGRQNKIGSLIDNHGGIVRAGDGSQLSVSEDAVSGSQSVFFDNVALQSAGVSLPTGYEVLAAFDVDLGSANLNSSATISVPGLTGDLSRVVVAQLITVGGQRSPKVVARAVVDANDKLVSTTAIPPLPAGVSLSGIRSTGRYLFIRVPSAFGYVKGTITDAATSAPQPMARVSNNQTPFVDLTGNDGQYVLVGAAGAAPIGVNQIGAAALLTDATGSATATLGTQDAVASVNVALNSVALQVESITPASGAQNMIATTPVTVTFNKPVAAQTLTGSSFTLSTDDAGNPVLGTITVLAGSRGVVFTPAATLASATKYKVSLTTAVRDIYGHALGTAFNSTFTTAAAVVISNRLKPEQIVVGYPDANGTSTISIPSGSVPNGSSILVVNTTSGSTLSTTTGSGALNLQIQARVGDEISLTITQADGSQYSVTQGAYRRADGFISVGSNGGTLTSDDGQILLSIPAGAISGQADLKLTSRSESDINIPRTGEMDPTEVPFGAGVRILVGGNFTNTKELHLEVAAPPTAMNGQRVAFMKPAKITEGNGERDVWEVVTSGKVEDGKFKTMSPPFTGVTIVSVLGFFDIDVFMPRNFRAVTGKVTELVNGAAPKPLPNVLCSIQRPGTTAQAYARTADNGRFGTLDLAASAGTTAVVEAIDTIGRTKTATATPYISTDPTESGLNGLQTLYASIQFASSAGLPETLPALLKLEGRMLDLDNGQLDTLQAVGRVPLGSHLEIKVTSLPNIQQISGQLLAGGNTVQQLTWTRQSSEEGTGVFKTDFNVTGEGSYSVVVTTFTQNNVLTTRATATFGFVALQNPNTRPPLEGPPRVMGVTPANGAQQIATGSRIHLDFSEPVKNLDPGTNIFVTDLATQQRISGEITSGGLPIGLTTPNISSIDFQPARGLEANKDYAVEVLTTVTDSDGHALDQDYTSPTDTDPQPFRSTFKTFRPIVIGADESQQMSYRLETAGDLGITVVPSTTGSSLKVYDLSAPEKPVVVGDKFVPFFATAYDIAEAEQDSDTITVQTPVRRVYEVIAVVLSYSVQDQERPVNAFIYSLDDPTAPQLIGVSSLRIPRSSPSYPMYVRIHHKRAYIGNSGRDSMEVVDLEEAVRTLAESSNPETAWFPAVTPGFNAGFDQEAKKQMASYARTPSEGAPVYSLSVMDQAVPAVNGGQPQQSPVVYVASNRLQLLSFDTNSSWDGTFALVDTNNDQLDDRVIGARDLEPAGFAVDVRTAPGLTMNGHSTDIAVLLGSDRLWLFDVTNPRVPQAYQSRSFADLGLGGGIARRMDVEDTLIYVMFADRVAVIDFSDPTHLVVRGVITGIGSDLRWISVRDGFVYTLDLASGTNSTYKAAVRTSIGSAAANVFVHGADGSSCMNPVLISRADNRMMQPAETLFKVYGLDTPQSGKVIIRKQTRTGDSVNIAVLAEVPAVFDSTSTADVLIGHAPWTSNDPIDRAATYTAELVINSGQPNEFRARGVPIVFSHLIDEYQDTIGVSGHRGGGKFAYILGAAAQVVLRVNGSPVKLGGSSPTFHSFGLQVEDIQIANLPPNLPPGNYQFKLSAILDGNPNITEEAEGTIVIEDDSGEQRQPANIVINNVEIETGNLMLGESDIPEIRNRGLSLSFTRSYNSQGSNTYNTLGYGWAHNYQVLLRQGKDPDNPTSNIYTIEGGEGSGQKFKGSSGELKSEAPFHTKLRINTDKSFDYFTKANVRYHFNMSLEAGSEQLFNQGYMGNLAFIEEPNLNRLTLNYDSQGRLATVTDSSNRKLTFTYEQGATPFVGTIDSGITNSQTISCTNKRFLRSLRRKFELGQLGVAWRIIQITGPGGLEVNYQYDAKGNLNRVERFGADGISQPTDPNVSVYTYDPSNGTSASTEHLIKSVQTPNHTAAQSHITTYEYESGIRGMMVKAIHMPEAVNNLYNYTTASNVVSETAVTDGRSNVTRYQFNNLNESDRSKPWKIVTVTAPLSAVSTLTFDGRGNKLSEVDPESRQITAQYDDNGNQILQTISGQGKSITTKATFDSTYAKPLSTTDGNGNQTTYSLDARGNVTRIHLPTGNEVQMDYGTRGDLSRMVDQYGFATNYQYDLYGNPTTVTRQANPGNVITNNTYDERSRLVTSNDTVAPSVQNIYDRFDRIVSQTVTDPSGFHDSLTTTFQYLPEGQVKKVTRNGGAQTIVVDNTYDGLNRLVQSVETPSGAGPYTQAYTYDKNSNVLSSTDRRGVTATRTYDELNFVRSETLSGPFGPQIVVGRLTEVDRLGNPVRVTNQYEQETTFEYDGLRRLIKRHLPGGFTEETGYDNNGNIVLQTDRNQGRTTFAYDEINRRTRMTDPGGRVTSWVFDDSSRSITQQNDPQGLTEKTTLDGLGRTVLREVKFTGATYPTRYSYTGRSVKTIDPRGTESVSQLSAFGETGTLTVTGANPAFNIQRNYSAFGGLKRAVDANGREMLYALDGLNRTTLITHTGSSFSESFAYDGAGNVVSHTDLRGAVSQMTYDNQGRPLVTTVQDESQQIAVQTIAYEDALSKETRTDAKGNPTVLTYDGLRRLKTEKNADTQTRTLDYDGLNLRQESDFKGTNTHYLYDTLNRVTQITDRMGQVTNISNSDSGGYRKSITDRRGNQRVEVYDPLQRLVSVTQGGEPVASYQYDGNNNRTVMIDGLNNQTGFSYDNLNRVTQIAHAGGLRTETFTYDGAGNVRIYNDGAGGPVEQTYDVLNHLKTRTDGAGNVTTFDYDGGGLLLERIDPKGAQYRTRYQYNKLGSLKQITDANNGVWEFFYDPAQNLTSIKDARDREVSYGYDSLNRLTTITQPQQHVTTYGYDVNSNRNAVTDPQNHLTNIGYDALDRIQSVTYNQPTGRGPRSYSYGYDPEGNVTSVDETTLLDTPQPITRRYTRTYDKRDRITSATDPFSHTVKFDYDAANNVVSLTDAASNPVGYRYDALNRVQTVTLSNQAATINYQWQADGLLKQVSYPSGMRRDYTYDAADRLTKVTNQINSTESDEFSYTYDANDNRATETRTQNGHNTRSIAYDYDLLDRLTSANYTTPGQRPADPAPGQSNSYTETTRFTGFGYDKVGNRESSTAKDRTTTITLTTNSNGVTSESRQNTDGPLVTTTAVFNDLNRLTQLSSDAAGSVATNYDYDRNGNLTAARQNSQVVTSYEYDCRDQLRRVLNGSNQEVAAYDYNFDRQRTGKTIGGVPLTFVYAGDQVINEYGLNDQLVNRYDLSEGEVLRAQLGGEGERYYFSDGQNSITSLAQQSANPSLTARYEYDAWGQYLASTGASYNSIGYTGQRFDGETGLMPLGNGERYYSPFTGNFIQQDSFTGMAMMAQSMNRYAYANNNPLRYTDPSGHTGLLADWLKQKMDKVDSGLAHFLVGAAYDTINVASGFSLGMVDVGLQESINAMQGKPSTPSQMLSNLWNMGYGRATTQSGTTGQLMVYGTWGAVKTVAGIAKAAVWDMNPIVMGYHHTRQAITELPIAWNDPERFNQMKRDQAMETVNGILRWGTDLYGGIRHPGLIVEAVDTVGVEKTAEIYGGASIEAVLLVDGMSGGFKGVQSYRAARATESFAEVAETTAMTERSLATVERSAASTGLSEATAASEVNPRLVQRLEAWRNYQAKGGSLDLKGWVEHTQGAPWGTGAKSFYGDWIKSVESVHGNSLLSSKPATLYRLETKTGEFLKWGISQDMHSRYTTAFMRDKQIFEVATGTRSEMLKLERELVETQPGKLNREPWAGTRRIP